MKYLYTTILAILFSVSAANSQVLIALVFGDKLNSEGLEFGLHAGANFSNLTGIDEAKYKSGLNLGFYFDIRLTEKIWLHPEVLVKTSVGARSIDPYPTGDMNLDSVLVDADLERNIGYVQTPILIKYKFIPGWSVEAGIQPALKVFKSQDIFTDIVFEKEDLEFRRNISKQYTTFDFGISGGFSWRPRKDKGTTVIFRYTHGLVNLLKDDSQPAQKNRQFLVGAAIPIGVKKAAQKRAEKEAEEAAGEGN